VEAAPVRVARRAIQQWGADYLSDKQRALLGDEVNNAGEGKAIAGTKELLG